MASVLIAGDYSPKDRVSQLIESDNANEIFADIQALLSRADYSIVNFESAVISKNSKLIKKAGPGMHCTPKAVELLKETGFDAVTLANNHFRDYGDEGVNNSICEFEKNGLDFFGGGRDLEQAEQIFYKEINGNKVAFINVCEHEFSIASKNRGGSAPLDVVNVSLRIVEAKKSADYVIVIIHGGNEHYQLPSPRMKKTYRFFVNMGADAVINHHQHCFSGYEVFQGKPIFYGLGNFCFDWKGRESGMWHEGYMVKLIIDNGVFFELIPYRQCDAEPKVLLLKEKEITAFKKKIEQLNKIISDDEKLSLEYDAFCEKRKRSIICPFTAYLNPYVRIAAGRHWIPYLLPLGKLIGQLNTIECESHRDVLLKVFHNEIDK